MNEGQRAMREVFNGSSRYYHLAGLPWHLELVKIRLVPLPVSSQDQSIKGEQRTQTIAIFIPFEQSPLLEGACTCSSSSSWQMRIF